MKLHARIVAVLLVVLAFAVAPAAFGRERPEVPDPAKGYKWQDEAKKRLKPAAVAQLGRDKILITDEASKQVFTPYVESGIPLFITSDSLLNAFHVLYEESVLRLETANARKLPEILRFIWKNLPSAAKLVKGKPELAARAKRRAQVVVGTALKLLGDTTIKPDKKVAALIDAEVKRITEAKATLKPKWLGPPDKTFVALDYSRYRPRGFYTRSPDLQRYFRAVSWLQSIPFRVSNDEELLAILMLGNTVTYRRFGGDFSAIVQGREFKSFFEIFREFVGAGDDWDIMKAAHEAQNLGSDDLSRKRKDLLEDAEGYGRGPKINDQVRFAPDDPTKTAEPNFRIISALRTPDAILFHRTTDLRQFKRPFPDGLEVCAALGSSYARSKLTGKDRKKLLETIDKSKTFFKGDSLYIDYLHCLAALVDKPEPDAPKFMSGEPWQIKSCQTALAGWAQLRHTWALQAKQTVHYLGMTEKPPGFVEPEPEFFARMAELVRRTEALLQDAGVLKPDMKQLAGEMRAAATLIEEKQLATKGEEALKEISLEEGMLLQKAMTVLMCFGVDPSPDRDKLKAFFAKLPGELRKAADKIDKGQLPNQELLKKALKEATADVAPLWRRLREVCLRLEALAHKQLRGVPFNDRDKAFILRYGEEIAGIMLYGGNSYLTPNDDAPRIVDVYANPTKGAYLAVGIGRARALYVLYPVKGGEVLCRGAVMPYYEFQNPKRLTDTEWLELLDSPKRPGIPAWVKPIVAGRELHKPVPKKR